MNVGKQIVYTVVTKAVTTSPFLPLVYRKKEILILVFLFDGTYFS